MGLDFRLLKFMKPDLSEVRTRQFLKPATTRLIVIIGSGIVLLGLCGSLAVRLVAGVISDRLMNLGVAATEERNFEVAAGLFNAAILLKPSSALAYDSRGAMYLAQSDMERALQDYDSAISLNPEFADAYVARAWIYEQKSLYDDALADLDRAIVLEASNHDFFSRRAAVFVKKSNFRRALKDIDKAIELASNDDIVVANYYVNRGFIHYSLHDVSGALGDYSKSIALNSHESITFFARSLIYGELDQPEMAIDDLSAAIELKPDYAMAYYWRGVMLQRNGQTKKALEDFETFLSLYKNTDEFSEYAKSQLEQH
jgi:tetratricopeptide (TPR) repeat protein